MNEKQIRALARRNAAKAAKAKPGTQRTYDETLDATRSRDDSTTRADAERMFKEMKKREF
jgi:hypothetical protein